MIPYGLCAMKAWQTMRCRYSSNSGVILNGWSMGEREHTLAELAKMEQVRNYLIDNQAIDADGFVDFLSELQ